MNKVSVKSIMSYKGHTISANGSVNLTLHAKYGEITNSVGLLQMLNNDVNIKVKMEGNVIKLGNFRIKSIQFEDDGESTVKFNSINDFVDTDGLNQLVTPDEFNVLFSASIEDEGEKDDEED